jgi:hypothetical protein
MRRIPKLLDRVGELHVVELAGAAQTLEVLAEAEHGGAPLGLIGADALEHPGAVVKPMAEYVDLGVFPCDQLAVDPDPVRLLHGSLQLTDNDAATRRLERSMPDGRGVALEPGAR